MGPYVLLKGHFLSTMVSFIKQSVAYFIVIHYRWNNRHHISVWQLSMYVLEMITFVIGNVNIIQDLHFSLGNSPKSSFCLFVVGQHIISIAFAEQKKNLCPSHLCIILLLYDR